MITMARAVTIIAEAGANDVRSFVAVRSRVNAVHARIRLWVKHGILPGALRDGRNVIMSADDLFLCAVLDQLANANVTPTRLAEVVPAVIGDELWRPATDGTANVALIVALDRNKTVAYLTDSDFKRPVDANYLRVELSGMFARVLSHLEQEAA